LDVGYALKAVGLNCSSVYLFFFKKNIFKKILNFKFFYFFKINIFLVFLDHFDVIILKIIFKK
jgi:hypothetical protein